MVVKPYYHYTGCLHALCNAHHLRELERAYEQDGQQWAKAMQDLLLDILADVKAQDANALPAEKAQHYTECYRNLLKQAEIECPPPGRAQTTWATRAGKTQQGAKLVRANAAL